MKKALLRIPAVQSAVYWRDYAKHVFNYTFRKEQALKTRFLSKCGYPLDLEDPKTYNEKLQWLKLHWYDPLAEQCADKAAVRDYVAQKGFADTLIPVIGVYSSVRQIPFDTLPDRYILKATHASGMSCLCTGKKTFSVCRAKSLCRRFLRVNYYYNTGEWVYRRMPRRIICEQFLETEDGKPPCDYKIYCFHGKPKCVMVASGRMEGRLCMDFFTPEWEQMPFKRHNPNSAVPPEKPAALAEMLAMAETLAAPFPHVRVDLYYVRGRIWFGEMTFFPATGMQPFEPHEYDELFGSWLSLDGIRK